MTRQPVWSYSNHHDDDTTASMSFLNLDEEVRLFSTPAERELYDSLATLYSIVLSLDFLERAYVRDSVTANE